MWLDLRQVGELPATNLCWNYTVLKMSDPPSKLSAERGTRAPL